MRALVGACTLTVTAALLSGDAAAQGEGKVELKVVKYTGLTEVIKRHRGKVVVIDFWADY